MDTMTNTRLKVLGGNAGVAVANALAVWLGIPPPKISATDPDKAFLELGIWAVEAVIAYIPTIATTIASVKYVSNKTSQNIAAIESGNGATVTKPPADIGGIIESKSIPGSPVEPFEPYVPKVSDPSTWAFPVYFPKDWDAYRKFLSDKIDSDLLERAKLGGVVGITASKTLTKESVREAKPELSSLNPSMRWSEAQKMAMSTEAPDNRGVLDFHIQILLPAAQEALLDLQQQRSGKQCGWPVALMAATWVAWCEEHIRAIQTIMADDSYNFAGFKVWEAGENAKAWVIDKVAWITTYNKGVPKDWKYPDKPEGWRQ